MLNFSKLGKIAAGFFIALSGNAPQLYAAAATNVNPITPDRAPAPYEPSRAELAAYTLSPEASSRELSKKNECHKDGVVAAILGKLLTSFWAVVFGATEEEHKDMQTVYDVGVGLEYLFGDSCNDKYLEGIEKAKRQELSMLRYEQMLAKREKELEKLREELANTKQQPDALERNSARP